MNPDTAEFAIAQTASELAPSGWWAALRADRARMTALRECWRALWISRAVVWAAGVSTVLAFGFGPVRSAFDPPGVTSGFGRLGDLLAAPAARWDSAWYLAIAHYGYRPELGSLTDSRTAFFPLYPLGVRTVSWLGLPPIVAGVTLSMVALAVALYGIHRLTTLELGAGVHAGRDRPRARTAGPVSADRASAAARLAVASTALAPMAFFFSAVYSESLYLALSVALFWSARHGRWAWVGLLGGLAGASRSTGLVLVFPALLIYLHGPREDRMADRDGRPSGLSGDHAGAGPLARALASARARSRPRYRLRRDVLWLWLMPLGLVLYCLFLGFSGGDAFAPLHAQGAWGRHFAGPFVGLWDGLKAAFDGARQLLSLQRRHVYYGAAGGSPFVNAGHNLMLAAFAAAAVPATVGVLRRLPPAYGVYVIAALAMPLSYPVSAQPLMSLPRFLAVLFPLNMWLGAWLAERPRARTPALVLSGALMAVFVAQFATWHWVA